MVKPGIRLKSRTLFVPITQPSSRAQAPMIRSLNGRVIPFAACSPPIRATISAVSSVTGWIGTVAFSSSRKAPPLADLGHIGAIDPVADLSEGERAENDRKFADCLLNGFDGLIWCEVPTFSRDQDAGVGD